MNGSFINNFKGPIINTIICEESVQGYCQGLRLCGPVQPGGRLGWCRGCQGVQEDACFPLLTGGAR